MSQKLIQYNNSKHSSTVYLYVHMQLWSDFHVASTCVAMWIMCANQDPRYLVFITPCFWLMTESWSHFLQMIIHNDSSISVVSNSYSSKRTVSSIIMESLATNVGWKAGKSHYNICIHLMYTSYEWCYPSIPHQNPLFTAPTEYKTSYYQPARLWDGYHGQEKMTSCLIKIDKVTC